MTATERLLELQAIDTESDRLRHRLADLPQMANAQRAREALLAWERRRTALRSRLDELTTEIESAEAQSGEIDRHRTRLEGQLRSVIAPREAEALQHEIAVLDQRRDEIDNRELTALEEQSSVDDSLVAHAADESALRESLEMANDALALAQSDLEAELAMLESRRGPLRDQLEPAVRARYDRLRDHLGVAVARLVGTRCDGCHLDLSAAEVEAIRGAPADELPACPQCDRILVR